MIRKIYFNSTRKRWSLMDPGTGLVDKNGEILKNVEFKVSEKVRIS